MGGDRYRVEGGMTVNNFSHGSGGDPSAWVKAVQAFSSCTIESLTAFDHHRKLVAYNNRFGTLDSARESDIVDLFSVFRYYDRYYCNASECVRLVEQVFAAHIPASFKMHSFFGWSIDCRAFPIFTDYLLVGGVVILAHRDYVNRSVSHGRGAYSGEQSHQARSY